MFELDLRLNYHRRIWTGRRECWGEGSGCGMGAIPKGAVLASLFRRSHIHYVLLITHLEKSFLDFTYYSTGAVNVLTSLLDHWRDCYPSHTIIIIIINKISWTGSCVSFRLPSSQRVSHQRRILLIIKKKLLKYAQQRQLLWSIHTVCH